MPPNLYAVIMAGGAGTRFWPLSREKKPKQVLSIVGPNSLLRDTVDRLEGLVPVERILIVTNNRQVKLIADQLPEIPERNYLLEPSSRNTAPCIGLAALHILRNDPNGVMLVLPSDHLIRDVERFKAVIRQGFTVVERDDPLVTIGIPPTRPETGYGYIQFNDRILEGKEDVFQVKTFAEKPNPATAERFVLAGDFYWNSGMFIWTAKRILVEIEEYLPEAHYQLRRIEKSIDSKGYRRVLSSRYGRIRPISIDYGVMERTISPIYMLKGDFGWSDVGSWDELYRISDKTKNETVIFGETVLLDASKNYIYSPTKLTAVVGMDEILVVNTSDATLICPLSRAQDVKTVVEKLRKEGRKKHI